MSNILELSRVSNSTLPWNGHGVSSSRTGSSGEPFAGGDRRPRLSRLYSLGGHNADYPKITGATRESLDDPADLERNVKEQMDLRSMSYKQRRKEAQKIKIRFFVTSLLNRQQFIMKLARALMTFGAPSHRIESQLVAAARILNVEVDAKKVGDNLDALLNSEPIYGIWTHCAINFWLSALICPLVFGRSLVDVFIAEFDALVLSSLQLIVVVKSKP
ncbi:hypothetical protein EDB86DRAFT_3102988 [Lactarius hatsudake]|nr:hypothetical protein EDB86DRAFT_3102988 [Lactarius hatsudake]